MEKTETIGILYVVVINHEEQYSIWPAYRDTPLGWTICNEPSEKQLCLDFIEENWTDMRPLSVRLQDDNKPNSKEAGLL